MVVAQWRLCMKASTDIVATEATKRALSVAVRQDRKTQNLPMSCGAVHERGADLTAADWPCWPCQHHLGNLSNAHLH